MKFHYKDKVKVVTGFYKGCHGEIKTVTNFGLFFKDYRYLIVTEADWYWVSEENIVLE